MTSHRPHAPEPPMPSKTRASSDRSPVRSVVDMLDLLDRFVGVVSLDEAGSPVRRRVVPDPEREARARREKSEPGSAHATSTVGPRSVKPNHWPVTSAPSGTSSSGGSSAGSRSSANVLGIVPGSGSGLGEGSGDGDGSGDGEKVSTGDGEDGLAGGAGGWPLHAPTTRATATVRVQLRMRPMVSADRRPIREPA